MPLTRLRQLHPPEVGSRGPLKCQAGQVHSSIGNQVEDGDDASNGVELPHQEHQLGKAGLFTMRRAAPSFSPAPPWPRPRPGPCPCPWPSGGQAI